MLNVVEKSKGKQVAEHFWVAFMSSWQEVSGHPRPCPLLASSPSALARRAVVWKDRLRNWGLWRRAALISAGLTGDPSHLGHICGGSSVQDGIQTEKKHWSLYFQPRDAGSIPPETLEHLIDKEALQVWTGVHNEISFLGNHLMFLKYFKENTFNTGTLVRNLRVCWGGLRWFPQLSQECLPSKQEYLQLIPRTHVKKIQSECGIL